MPHKYNLNTFLPLGPHGRQVWFSAIAISEDGENWSVKIVADYGPIIENIKTHLPFSTMLMEQGKWEATLKEKFNAMSQ